MSKHPDVGCGEPSKMADVPVDGCNVCFDTAVQEVRPVSHPILTDERSGTKNVYQGWCVRLSSAVCLWTLVFL